MKAHPKKIQGFAIFSWHHSCKSRRFESDLTVCGTETFNDAIERLINAKASRDEA